MAKSKKQPAFQQSRFLNYKLPLAGILLLTCIVFSTAIKNNFIINWDDDVYVTINPLIKDLSFNGIKNIFTSTYEGNYHPLLALLNAIEYKLFGLHAPSFHVVSLLLHLLNACLVFYLFRLVSGKMEISAIVALLFAIHPMHTESVAWIAEQKDVLYAFFYLLSLIFYLRYKEEKQSSDRLYILSLLFFVCSLLSKPMAVTLPAALILLDYYQNRLRVTDLKSLARYIPFFFLAAILGIVTFYSQTSVKTIGSGEVFSFVDRICLAAYALVLYLFKLILPINQSAFYSFPEKVNGLLPIQYYIAPLIVLLIGFGIYKLKKFRTEFIFGFLFFLITVSVVLQLIPVGGAVVAERYTYIPYLGLFFVGGTIYSQVQSKSSVARIILLAYVAVLSALTFNRNKVWQNAYTLFSDTVKKNQSYLTYFNLGFAKEIIKEDYEGALADYEMSFKLKKDFHLGYNNYGIVKGRLGDYEGALSYFGKAIEAKPDYAEAYCNRGISKNFLKNYAGAILDFNEAVRLKPGYGKAFSKRAESYYHLDKRDEAYSDLKKAATLGDEDAKNILQNLNK